MSKEITFDPLIKICYGGQRNMEAVIVNGSGEQVGELYLLKHYQIATIGWYETIDTLSDTQGRIEELERLLGLRDIEESQTDFLQGTR